MGGEEGLGSQQAKNVSAITHERVADVNVCVLLTNPEEVVRAKIPFVACLECFSQSQDILLQQRHRRQDNS